VQGLPQPGLHAAHPRMHEGSCAGQLQEQNFVDPPAPARASPLAETTPGEQPRLVVVRAVVRRARMRHVHGNERNAGLQVPRRNRGGDPECNYRRCADDRDRGEESFANDPAGQNK